MIKCDVCGKELTKEVSSFYVCDSPQCVQAEDQRTTLHGIKQKDIVWLIDWYERYSARYSPDGWVVSDLTWIDILRNSANYSS